MNLSHSQGAPPVGGAGKFLFGQGALELEEQAARARSEATGASTRNPPVQEENKAKVTLAQTPPPSEALKPAQAPLQEPPTKPEPACTCTRRSCATQGQRHSSSLILSDKLFRIYTHA